MKPCFTIASSKDARLTLDAQRTVLIHDLDGVHHRYDGLRDLYDFYAQIKYQTLSPHFPEMSAEEIKRHGLDSYKQTGDGLLLFHDLAIARGMSKTEAAMFRERIFRDFHQAGRQALEAQAPNIFKSCSLTLRLFEDVAPFVRHGLLTQSCGENWGQPILQAQGKLRFFEAGALIDFAACDFVTKAMSVEPLRHIMRLMNARPEQCVFLEDSLANLERAKQLSPEIMTVYICHDLPLAELPSYVDMQARGLNEILYKLRKEHLEQTPSKEMAPGL